MSAHDDGRSSTSPHSDIEIAPEARQELPETTSYVYDERHKRLTALWNKLHAQQYPDDVDDDDVDDVAPPTE